MQDCFDFSGAGLTRKVSDSDKAKIVNSYYYTKEIEAGMTEEEAQLAVETAKEKKEESEAALQSAKTKVNQIKNPGYEIGRASCRERV